MPQEYSMAVHVIRGFLYAAATQGLDVNEALAAAGCPHALDDEDGRVPWQQTERICAAFVERIGIAGMLRAMVAFRAERSNPVYHVARHSPTVGVALRRIVKYGRVSNGLADYRLIEGPRSSQLQLVQRDFLSAAYRRVVSATWAVALTTVLHQLAGPDFEPTEVSIEAPSPTDADEIGVYRMALPFSLQYSHPHSIIEFDSRYLEREIPGAIPILEVAMLRHVAALAAQLPDDATVGRRLSPILVESIQRGDWSLDTVARQLGTTVRTMQRKLRDEGTSYRQVLDDVRHEIAVAQMRHRRVPSDEIASLLGFDQSSSFHRAFKRWTGLTPGEYRKKHANTVG